MSDLPTGSCSRGAIDIPFASFRSATPILATTSPSRWIEVVGGPRVLVVSGYEPSPLATLLRAQGIEVEEVADLAKVHVGMLAGAKGVILDNVPAHRLDPAFIRGLEFFVTEQGGGWR